MIREAVAGDIPDLVEMARRFHSKSRQFAPFCEDAAEELGRNLIESASAVIFRTDGGMIGGVLAPAHFSKSWLLAVELFWWAEDRNGLRLLGKFESWARDAGANEVRMTTLDNLDAAEKILRKRGYRATEISYGKVI